jgi:hypothetical protein
VIFRLGEMKLGSLYYPEWGMRVATVVERNPQAAIIVNGCFYSLKRKYDLNGAVVCGGRYDERGPVPDATDWRQRGWKHGATVRDNRYLAQFDARRSEKGGGYEVGPGQPPENASAGVGGLLWAIDSPGKLVGIRYFATTYGLIAFSLQHGVGVIVAMERSVMNAAEMCRALHEEGADFAVLVDGGPSLCLAVDGQILIQGETHTRLDRRKPVSQYISFSVCK